MNIGSRSIDRLLSAIRECGEGVGVNYFTLLEASGIAEEVTLAKAIKEAKAQGLIRVEQGRGRVASRYWIAESVRAIL